MEVHIRIAAVEEVVGAVVTQVDANIISCAIICEAWNMASMGSNVPERS